MKGMHNVPRGVTGSLPGRGQQASLERRRAPFRACGALVAALATAALLTAAPARAQFGEAGSAQTPGTAASARLAILKDVKIDQLLDHQVPLDTPFVNETGQHVTLGDYFGKKPVVLVLAYYTCPMLCPEVLKGMVDAIQAIPFQAGRDFQVVVVSFDPKDTPAVALEQKKLYETQYGRAGSDSAFHFLTGQPDAIKTVTSAVGFHYSYIPATGQYAHPTMITVLTPSGRISRYLMGIDYPPRDLRMALDEASNGKIGNVVNAVLLYCCQYDPSTGSYNVAIMNVIRLVGGVVLLLLGGFVTLALRRERRKKRLAAGATAFATGAH